MPFGLTNAPADKTEYEKQLKAILELLKKEKLGIHLDPAKIESIKDWASLKKPMEIRQFLGLAGYYRRFIEGFLKIAKSMTKLTQKGIKFDWGEKEDNSFSVNKAEREKVIAYASRQLKIHEKNYTTYDLELGLELNMSQRRWLELLSDYDCDIRYHPIRYTQERQTSSDRSPKPENLENEDVGGMIRKDIPKEKIGTRAKTMEFEVGDRVMLKVLPWKGVVLFGKWGKLNLRYVRPFKVLAKVGKVAYRLELLQELSRVHHTFHVSNLKKCYADEPLAMPLEGIHIDDKL
ncbi:hypothetical protein Tco_0072841 [Tanacetum coccineum]